MSAEVELDELVPVAFVVDDAPLTPLVVDMFVRPFPYGLSVKPTACRRKVSDLVDWSRYTTTFKAPLVNTGAAGTGAPLSADAAEGDDKLLALERRPA